MSFLLQIDELLRDQHYYISEEDVCYYLMEYFSKQDYSYGRANNLISNIKKPMARQGQADWKWKGWAINEIARELREGLAAVVDFSNTTLIPVPPSKCKEDPEYDDRVVQILKGACPASADIREIISCTQSREAAHVRTRRPSVQELIGQMHVDKKLLRNLRPNVVIFDDMITAGATFAACKQLLQHHGGNDLNICGIFAARRIISINDFDDD